MKEVEAQTITSTQYLALLGLRTLAEQHNKALSDLCDAVRQIVKDGERGHVEDFVYIDSDVSLDEFLKRVNATVEPSGNPTTKE